MVFGGVGCIPLKQVTKVQSRSLFRCESDSSFLNLQAQTSSLPSNQPSQVNFTMDAPQAPVMTVPDFSMKDVSVTADGAAGNTEQAQTSVVSIIANGKWLTL